MRLQAGLELLIPGARRGLFMEAVSAVDVTSLFRSRDEYVKLRLYRQAG